MCQWKTCVLTDTRARCSIAYLTQLETLTFILCKGVDLAFVFPEENLSPIFFLCVAFLLVVIVALCVFAVDRVCLFLFKLIYKVTTNIVWFDCRQMIDITRKIVTVLCFSQFIFSTGFHPLPLPRNFNTFAENMPHLCSLLFPCPKLRCRQHWVQSFSDRDFNYGLKNICTE